jgi:hypothetical protein
MPLLRYTCFVFKKATLELRQLLGTPPQRRSPTARKSTVLVAGVPIENGGVADSALAYAEYS